MSDEPVQSALAFDLKGADMEKVELAIALEGLRAIVLAHADRDLAAAYMAWSSDHMSALTYSHAIMKGLNANQPANHIREGK